MKTYNTNNTALDNAINEFVSLSPADYSAEQLAALLISYSIANSVTAHSVITELKHARIEARNAAKRALPSYHNMHDIEKSLFNARRCYHSILNNK